MKRFLISIFLVLLVSGFVSALTEQEIEKTLMDYKEKGYTFEKKLGKGSWKVSFGTGSWKEAVYIYISQNEANADFNIVYIYGGVKSYNGDEELSKAFEEIVSAMEVNSSTAEWGFFSLYKEDNVWYLDYNVKLRQKYLDEVQLMNAIGWVAASVNKYKRGF
jgi:outer membrane lipoprotein-sorting protein